MPKILSIVETAYRATLEEQDDTVLWLTHILAGAGLDQTLLLRGNAVSYLAKAQDAAGLAIAGRSFGHPARLADDVRALVEKKNVPVYFVEEDVTERGLGRPELIAGPTPVSRSNLARFVAGYDQVWHW